MIEKDDNRIPKALVIEESFLGFHEVNFVKSCLSNIQPNYKSINFKNIPLNKCRGQGYM